MTKSNFTLPEAPLASVSTPVAIIGVAVAYFLAGCAGLFWATETGFASPIWPASGIALAGMLMLGFRVWIGIAAAAFVVNLCTTIVCNPAASWISLEHYAVSLGIALGAALQAVVATFLIYRFVNFPGPLARANDAMKFLLFGGPVGCLTNALIGPAILVGSGTIPVAAWLETAVTWWGGDVLGVLIFTPAIIVWGLRPVDVWRPRRLPVTLTLLASFALVTTAYIQFRSLDKEKVLTRVEQRAAEVSRNFKHRIHMAAGNLRAANALHATMDSMTPQKYGPVMRAIVGNDSTIRALSWNPRFPAEERGRYEALLQDFYGGSTRISERSGDGKLVPAQARDEYVPVFMIEPFEENKQALGYDVLSNPLRRDALHRARDTGKPVATGRIELVQESAGQYGFLIFLPSFQAGLPLDTTEDRRRAIRGYHTAVFSAGRFIGAVMEGFRQEGLRICFVDTEAPAGQKLLHEVYTGGGAKEGAVYAAEWEYGSNMLGRNWVLKIAVADDYVNSQLRTSGWEVFIPGLLISALAGMLVLIVTGRNAELAKQVAKRTQDLTTEINERVVAEEAARDSAERLRLLMDSVPVLINYVDNQMRYRFVNSVTAEWYARDRKDLVGQHIADILPKEGFDKISASMRAAIAGEPQFVSGTVTYPDGVTRDVEINYVPDIGENGVVNGFFALGQDVTQRNLTEEKLRKSEKLDAVANVTGGVAHEFNNLFMVISGSLELLRQSELAITPASQRRLDNIMASIFRAKVLTGRMLSYTGNPFDQPDTFQVEDALNEIANEMRPVLSESIAMDIQTCDEPLAIHVDPEEFKNAIANLAYNSRDAMPQGGKITISVNNVTHDGTSAGPLPAEMAPGEYVCVAVADTGTGMDPDVMAKVFDPFFTTKEVGMGSGLGLSMIYGFVHVQSKGFVDIESHPGEGTVVSMYFPKAAALRDEVTVHVAAV